MATVTTTLHRRQIWAKPSPTRTTVPHSCSPYRLPSGGIINVDYENILTLTADAVFQPLCTSVTLPTSLNPQVTGTDISVFEKQDPFYTSTSPLIYAISGATIISYMLVIILFATPRTFYIGGPGGGVSLLGRKSTLGGAHSSNTVIGVGSRPWLQKIAAVTLAISMTIVTYDAFKYGKKQYTAGYEDAEELTRFIIDGLEIKIVRLISETFLWLAQAQTLIRLFQRHREKMVIKWTAFVLISLEVIFAILNHFVHESTPHQPRAFANSIPALNYLFTLALNICYAAFVIVYSLRKRRFAFVHPQMHSMPLMALLSMLSVLIPVVFFILDLSKPDVSGWGSYVRWVGACAASVVVWEWVERIEALEREEKKDGILGREVFDGDEMLSHDTSKRGPTRPGDDDKDSGHLAGIFGHHLTAKFARVSKSTRRRRKPKIQDVPPFKIPDSETSESTELEHIETTHNRTRDSTHHHHHHHHRPGPPPITTSPVSRTDSSSNASTVYAVRYHPPTESTPPPLASSDDPTSSSSSKPTPQLINRLASKSPKLLKYPSRLSRIPLPFRRQRQTPPAEVAAALAIQQPPPQATPSPAPPPTILDRLHLRRTTQNPPMPKGVIYVPAPPRRRPSMSASAHDQQVEHFQQIQGDGGESEARGSESESEGGDERPPAVVRNAIRRSTTPAASPANAGTTENGAGVGHTRFTPTPAGNGTSPPICEEQQEQQTSAFVGGPSAPPADAVIASQGEVARGEAVSRQAPVSQIEDFAIIGPSAPPAEVVDGLRQGEGQDTLSGGISLVVFNLLIMTGNMKLISGGFDTVLRHYDCDEKVKKKEWERDREGDGCGNVVIYDGLASVSWRCSYSVCFCVGMCLYIYMCVCV